MRSLLLFSMIFIAAIPGLASTPDYGTTTTSCSVYYLRHERDWVNVSMICDGKIIFAHKTQVEEEMANPWRFKHELKLIFLRAVNPNGDKKCIESQNKKMWRVVCSLPN